MPLTWSSTSASAWHGPTSRRLTAASGAHVPLAQASRLKSTKPSSSRPLLYGAESWALSAHQTHRLNVFNTTCLRRMLHVKRSDHKPNAELYEEAGVPATSEATRKHRRYAGLGIRLAVPTAGSTSGCYLHMGCTAKPLPTLPHRRPPLLPQPLRGWPHQLMQPVCSCHLQPHSRVAAARRASGSSW